MKPKKIGKVQTVDMETGRIVSEQRNAMTLLPPKGDVCQECAVNHAFDQPHNQQSLYYQMQFHSKNGRWPTWTDALAHCPDPVKAAWRPLLRAQMEKAGMPIPPDLRDDEPRDPARPA